MIWKLLAGLLASVTVLAVVMVARTVMIGPPPLDPLPVVEPVAIDKHAAAARLAQAIRIKTVSRAPDAPVAEDAFRNFHRFLARSYPRVHEELDRETVGGHSLLYTWRGSEPGLKPILLSAHMDVVPVETGTETDWTYPPFSGAVADGFIWGRGTLDMKTTLIGYLEAVETLLNHGFAPKRAIYLAFSHDEEVGGRNGTSKIVELLKNRGVRLSFTLDEGSAITNNIVTGVKTPAALVGLAEKGYVTLELTAQLETTQCGHSSMPPPSTAAGKLARAIHRLESNQMPASVRSPTSEMFANLAPEMSLGTRFVLANRWLLDPLLLAVLQRGRATNALIRTTTAPTIMTAGVKENVLPCRASGTVNFRILPGDTIEGIRDHLRETIDDPDVTVRQTGNEPSEATPVSDSGSASFATLRKTIRQVFPEATVAPSLVIGRTDSRRYVPIADNSYRFIPIPLGPEDLARFHGTDERVSVEDFGRSIHFYIRLIENSASS